MSNIRGSAIVLEAPLREVILYDTSHITATGTSFEFNESLMEYKTFPRDLAALQHSFGKQGKPDTPDTAGGGLIMILADCLRLISHEEEVVTKLSANGLPEKDSPIPLSLPGGDGGTIYLRTTNRHALNAFSNKIRIEAMGGAGL